MEVVIKKMEDIESTNRADREGCNNVRPLFLAIAIVWMIVVIVEEVTEVQKIWFWFLWFLWLFC